MKDLEIRVARLEATVRQWQLLTTAVGSFAIIALLSAIFLHGIGTSKQTPSLTPVTALPKSLDLDYLNVKWFRVVDEQGKTVIFMHAGAGGGLLSVDSGEPHDHTVMISATQYGASLQVSSQKKPRHFGELKIMDGKPYLQMYEEQDHQSPRNFYQAPIYDNDGSIVNRVVFDSMKDAANGQ